MALDEYKFIVPETESDEDKKERLKSELISMEEHYKMQEDAGVGDAKLDILADISASNSFEKIKFSFVFQS